MKKTALIVAVAGLSAGVALGVLIPKWWVAPVTGQNVPSATQATPGASAIPVEIALAQELDFPRGISAVGSLLSNESVVLRPETSGRIQHIDFQEGQPVQRDQVLIRLDAAVPQAELDQARASLGLAQSQYRRAVDLQGKGFVSQQARDDAASTLKLQQAAVALAQAKLDKMTIRAPFTGVAGLRSISVGDYVNQGQDLAPLEAIDPLKVDFRVPEMYLGKIRHGQTLTVRLDALPAQEREGVVYAISPLVDTGGRSILLRAKVANADAVLRPGMFARVQLLFGQDNALVIPEAALSPAGEAQYAYRVQEGIARRVEIRLGERRDGKVEVLSGLSAGDAVVVAGLQRIRDGAAVQIAAPAQRP